MAQRVVVLGAGFGGAYCARRLERSDEFAVELLDRRNYFVFSPLLVEAGTGSLEPRHTVVAVRSFVRRARFRNTEIQGIDPAKREVTHLPTGRSSPERLPYDHLVLALGSVTRLPPVPGLREFGHELKSLADAVALRDRMIALLEAAENTADADARRALLHLVVVGGNFTGVEVAGEFIEFLRSASRSYRNFDPAECRVTIVEMQHRILGPLDGKLAERGRAQLAAMGVEFRLEDSVREVRESEVVLQSGETLASRTVVWCAGIAPPPLLGTLDLPRDEHGYLLCDETLRVKGFENVWAIGDCAVTADATGRPSAATAQQAVREGNHLACNLIRAARGEAPRPLPYRSVGSLAALGARRGVGNVMGVPVHGFLAWFLWRTVYLGKTPGWSRRLRIAADWTLDFVFGRSYVQLGVHDRGPKAEGE
ncbi:NAD(P)/FAD-dependent oxidoreductase [bacterium]|nr:NAD(P)/FAD-dependent oxidoreductase [bacterium]